MRSEVLSTLMEAVFKAASRGDLFAAEVAHDAVARILTSLPDDSRLEARIAHAAAARLLQDLADLRTTRLRGS